MDEKLQEFFEENRETVSNAVANRYGLALAKKASPALMLSLAMPEPSREGFDFSSFNLDVTATAESGEVPTSSAIVEFGGGEQTGREAMQLQLGPCELSLREKEVDARRREFEQIARE